MCLYTAGHCWAFKLQQAVVEGARDSSVGRVAGMCLQERRYLLR